MEARTTLGLYGSAQPHQDQAVRPQGVGGAPDGAHVARVLHPVQHQIAVPGQRLRRAPSPEGGPKTGPPGASSWGRSSPSRPWAPGPPAPPGAGRGSSTPSDTTTVVRGACHFRASSNSFLPSPRYSPAARRSRPLPAASFRIRVSRGFFRLVIRSIGSLLLSILQGCAERHTNGKLSHWYAIFGVNPTVSWWGTKSPHGWCPSWSASSHTGRCRCPGRPWGAGRTPGR